MNCFKAAIIAITTTASPSADVHSDSGVPENQEPFDGYLPSVMIRMTGQPMGKQIARKITSTSISITRASPFVE